MSSTSSDEILVVIKAFLRVNSLLLEVKITLIGAKERYWANSLIRSSG
jgi:hypothetical protein